MSDGGREGGKEGRTVVIVGVDAVEEVGRVRRLTSHQILDLGREPRALEEHHARVATFLEGREGRRRRGRERKG